MGRPEIPIDWDLVDKMIEQQCNAEEIAGEFYLSISRFYERFTDKHPEGFPIYRKTLQSKGKGLLRRKQWEKATIDGNVPLLLKLGELYLDQEQKQDSQLIVKIIDARNNSTEAISVP